MTLFQTILLIVVCIYVLSSLYFAISGRILAIKDRKEDLDRRNKDAEYENQLNVLTTRVGEVMTQNYNLDKQLREWQVGYSKLKMEYDELKSKLETPKKTSRKKKDEEK